MVKLQTLQILIYFLVGLFTVGCTVRCIILLLSMAFETGDKSGYKQQIKHVLIVLGIVLSVTGVGSIPTLIRGYFIQGGA